MNLAFVPCRLKSSRLPNKAIKEIYGIPAIERCLLNTMAIKEVDKVILATSINPEDDVLEHYTLNGKVELVRGSEEDVLARVILSIEKYQPEYVLRITGDCPLVSYEMASALIASHIERKADVTLTNSKVALGLNSEVYTAQALLRLREFFPQTLHSEYLIWYFLTNNDIFNVNQVAVDDRFVRNWRLTLDEQNDLTLFQNIYSTLNVGERPVAFHEVESFFANHPDAYLVNINNGVKYKDNQELIEKLKLATRIR